eukprot:CAMPEP_0198582490 /NCGR_PEP_ID=MMETSP1462-20131121/125564_1 /TAXON_ID=1333877 /ORGANISM="Brandtodinium nutriculum, Strain RCC3387" /LENGTH=45 /DNA_ID= /DNA_START= /DNA_END= /DNA_ORIENTATION=
MAAEEGVPEAAAGARSMVPLLTTPVFSSVTIWSASFWTAARANWP